MINVRQTFGCVYGKGCRSHRGKKAISYFHGALLILTHMHTEQKDLLLPDMKARQGMLAIHILTMESGISFIMKNFTVSFNRQFRLPESSNGRAKTFTLCISE